MDSLNLFFQTFAQNILRHREDREENYLLNGILPVLLNVGIVSTEKDIRSLRYIISSSVLCVAFEYNVIWNYC